MVKMLSYCFKINPNIRVYPNFDDCDDDLKIARLVEKIERRKRGTLSGIKQEINNNILSESLNYDIDETIDNLKENNEYIDFMRKKNLYLKIILKNTYEYVDEFHRYFFK